MLNKYILFALIGFFVSNMHAQHCGYDHTAIIGVRPIQSDSQIIHGLRITLVDALGKPIMVSKSIYKRNQYVSSYKDTAEFWRNPNPTKQDHMSIREEEKRHFMQAGQDYIILTGFFGRIEKGRYVKIEDIDGAANGGFFETKLIYIRPEQIQSLCGYPNRPRFSKDEYLPAIVILEKQAPRGNFKDTRFWNGYKMEFDRNPLVNCPECKGCYCQLLQVFDTVNALIYQEVLMGNDWEDSKENKIDSIQFEDYNFDGFPDLRFFNPRLKFQNIMLFNEEAFKNKYKIYHVEPLLSRMMLLELNKKEHVLSGAIIDTVPHSLKRNKTGVNYWNQYQMSGKHLSNVRVISSYNYILWNGYQPQFHDSFSGIKDTGYFEYKNFELVRQNKVESKIIYQTSKTNKNIKFELSIFEIKARDLSQLDAFSREIKIYNMQNGKLCFLNSAKAKKRNFFKDSIETGDYNFDGFTDIRICDTEFPCQYFIYDAAKDSFIQDAFLSKMDDIEFHFKSKVFIGDLLLFHKKDKNLGGMYPNNEYLKSQSRYYGFGVGIQYVKEFYKEYQHTKDGLRATDKINYYRYENQILIPIKEAEYQIHENKLSNNHKTTIKGKFKFVLEKNAKGVNIPSVNGAYANKIEVFDIKSEKLIFSMIAYGNTQRETPRCADSLEIADYNFDGFPDFRVCTQSGHLKHTYYIYHPKRKTFIIEKTLSELHGLIFNFEQKTAKGQTDRKEFMGYPWDAPYQYYMETLQFEGDKLENLTVTTTVYGGSNYVSAQCKYVNQKRIYEGDTIGLELQKKNLLIKEVGPFRFEMEFNPEERKTSGEKGAYVKVLNIYEKDRSVGGLEMHGNYLKEVPHWLDSMEIADYNFDGYPDIRMYNSIKANGSYQYFLFNTDKEVRQFYMESWFSGAIESEFIPSQKTMKGKLVEANLTRYLFLKNDTLTITIQDNDLSKPPFIEESIYKNGNRRTLRTAYGKLEPEIKKEYGDFNFDGFEDFRQQSKKSPYYWDVYIYNKSKETFEKDTLLSKFEVFNYNKLEKKLDGYYTQTSSNFLTRTSYYYQWSFTENKMILYQTKVCLYKFPSSESTQCTVSRLVDGKWIETETFGAE